MYILILIYLTAGGALNTSSQVLAYPSKEECVAAGPPTASFQWGIETAKGEAEHKKPDDVYWYCLPVKLSKTTT